MAGLVERVARKLCHYGNAGADTNSCCAGEPLCRDAARTALAEVAAWLDNDGKGHPVAHAVATRIRSEITSNRDGNHD